MRKVGPAAHKMNTSENVATQAPERQETVEQAVLEIAQRMGEAPQDIRSRIDVTRVLGHMEEGTIIDLHISWPRFTLALDPEDLGIKSTPQGEAALREYFQLGKRSILPAELRRRVSSTENSARACLERHALILPWRHLRYFVPVTRYREWKFANQQYERAFFALRDEILARYDELVARVLRDYRDRFIPDAWRRYETGDIVVKDKKRLTQDQMKEIHRRLKTEKGMAEYVERYLEFIRKAMPTPEEIQTGFVYECTPNIIPLPSVLARDLEQAKRISQERVVLDAEQRMRLSEREAAHRLELERIERQRDMERDIIENAKQRKQQMVNEFFGEIMAQIYDAIYQVCHQVLETIEVHGGKMQGPSAKALQDLVKSLGSMNFMQDEGVEAQIEKLRSILPTAGQASDRVKYRPELVGHVLHQMKQEASDVLIELGHQPHPRRKRRSAEGEEFVLPFELQRRRRGRPRDTDIEIVDGVAVKPKKHRRRIFYPEGQGPVTQEQ